jgi:hypothetical protein
MTQIPVALTGMAPPTLRPKPRHEKTRAGQTQLAEGACRAGLPWLPGEHERLGGMVGYGLRARGEDSVGASSAGAPTNSGAGGRSANRDTTIRGPDPNLVIKPCAQAVALFARP